MKRTALLAFVACLWGCALPGTGRAGMITYTETFTASGTLGTKSFTDEMVTITGVGDTANVGQSGTNFVNGVTATVTVAGVGTANVTDSISAVDRTGVDQAGFFYSPVKFFTQFLLTSNDLFASYDLTTDIGPASGGLGFTSSSNHFIGTDQGDLTFSNISADGTFQASLATPEPASLTLLGIGAAGLLGYGWRRKRAAA